MKNYVIIGGGIAAAGCIEGIRSVDKEGPITMITNENTTVYCRPLISYYLQGKTDFEKMKYRPDSFYTDNKVNLVYDTATAVSSEKKTVTLASGEVISYDSLCVATGSSPFVPPFAGLDSVEKKCSFMTEKDAVTLESFITPESRVLIVGAGLIGLKCAEGICERVASLTVTDLAPRVLSSILDDPCAAMMQKALEDHGVKFLLGDSADHFESDKAVMKSGAVVDFDVLVLAVGVRPNTALAKDAGADVDRGILIDNSMMTSVADIYSAGDCTQGYDASTGEKRILAILPNAYMQGHCAGKNMAGEATTFDMAIPMNAIGFFGLHALTAGRYAGDLYEERTETTIKRLFVENNQLIGFMMIGDVDKAGIYTSLIREKTPLDTIDFDRMKIAPTFASFSSETRRHKLGGVI